MPLTVGSRLGHYDVTALIGEGGMGQVYQATDTKLNRQVALKILPEAFATDPDRLARFQREAQVLASLNHPNIAQIHGLEESDGVRGLVLELVEGPTLADRIGKGPIPVDEALPIAKQIAEALEAAHEAGVIHRDLKPANIKVKDDGTVKVLDFGLAKALDTTPQGDPSQSPTLTAAATQMGVIMGTAAYMSPEQARGKPVDRRADIWSFGAVMFEMLTGRRAFAGEDVSLTLSAVLQREPAWGTLPPNVPPGLNTYLRRCLHKDPTQRVQAAGDVRLAMEGAFETTAGAPAAPMAVQVAPSSRLTWAVAVLGIMIGGVAVWNLKPASSPTTSVQRFSHVLTADEVISDGDRQVVAFSPDGFNIVYTANEQLYLRMMSALESNPITGTDDRPEGPFFSPDGQWIAYFSIGDLQLKKIALSGGAPVTICDSPDPANFGASWSADDTIVFGRPEGVFRVSANGGTPELIVEAEAGEQVYGPQVLPGDEWVLFSTTTGAGVTRWDEAQIVVQSVTSGERRVLVEGGSDALYLPTGHLVYALEDVLYGVVFDVDGLEVVGGPVSLIEGITRAGRRGGNTLGGNTAAANYGVSVVGSLVYLTGRDATIARQLVWVDREGNEELVAAEPREYLAVRLSPDGGRAAVVTSDADGNQDVLIYDLARDVPTRFTFDDDQDSFPVWSPDGERVAFASGRDGSLNVFWKAADGTGEAERLTTGARKVPSSWSPDGESLVLVVQHPETRGDIAVLPMDGDGTTEPETLVETEGNDYYAEISPDGGWMAYASSESGQMEVYVRPFPNVESGKWQVSQDAGSWPVWAPDGRQLFYRNSDLALMAAPIDIEPTFRPGNPIVLFDAQNLLPASGPRAFDIAPDGQRFLMIKPYEGASEDARPQINIVENWYQELLERVPSQLIHATATRHHLGPYSVTAKIGEGGMGEV